MNISQTLKQTWRDSRQHPVYTTLYITGVALAIVFTMVFSIIFFVKTAPFYPEYNRNCTYYLDGTMLTMGTSTSRYYMGAGIVKDHIYNVKNAEIISVTEATDNDELPFITVAGTDKVWRNPCMPVDANFFKIYELSFTEGHPITQDDFDAGSQVAVISDRLAITLFRSEDAAIGQEISINYVPYRVIGVVKEAPTSMARAFSQIYIPYTALDTYKSSTAYDTSSYLLGSLVAHFKVKDSHQAKLLQEEANEIARRIVTSDSTITEFEVEPIYTNAQFQLAEESWGRDGDWWSLIKRYGLVFLALLLVPALNLSGMISSRMDSRLSEMGIRKAFGATKSKLLTQVLLENLYLTLIGSLIGLILSYICILITQKWILSLFEDWPNLPGDFGGYSFSAEMLFSPVVFLSVMLLCLVLNLVSGFIPAWLSLRRPIVSSINQKR